MDKEAVCSVRLSWLLDRIISTEEEVTMRRKADSINWYVKEPNDKYKCIFSGSRGEGLIFKTSDVDCMYVLRNTVVLNSAHDKDMYDASNDKMLLMRRDGCRPGFVLLQCIEDSFCDIILKSMVQYHGMAVVSSLIMRDEWASYCWTSDGHCEPHGPCSTWRLKTVELDHALCFGSYTWPLEAYGFIHRNRQYGWPSKDLIDRIVQSGCHLVAIGDPNSEISHIQWRLSFSAAEKLLIHYFNHTQLKVYGLLKIFLKQAINTEESVKDLLCSYFLKTAVFYSIETTPQSIWTEELLIFCFWFCFNKLITWVEQGNCPNYFVPENNMFRSKVYGERRQNLLRVLNGYKRLGWTCLCQCKDLKPLKAIVKRPQIGAEYQLTNERKFEVSLDERIFQRLNSQIYLKISNPTNLKFIGRSVQVLTHSRSRYEEDIASHSLCFALQEEAQRCISKLNTGPDATNNKSRYLQMRKCKRLLSFSTILDLSTRYLTEATFYYIVGNYRKSLEICELMLLRWKPTVIYIGENIRSIPDFYKHHVCGRNLSIRDKLRSAVAYDFVLGKHHEASYPKELHHHVKATLPYGLCIPPLPYMAFLVFLCHHNLGNIDSSLSALRDLRTLVDDKYQGGRKNYVVFNLLAICLQKLGDVRGAIEACLKSLQREQNMNGAFKLLDELICEARR